MDCGGLTGQWTLHWDIKGDQSSSGWLDGNTEVWRDGLTCCPVLALTIQKISINYCSFYLFEGTLIRSEEWPRSPVTKRKIRAGNIAQTTPVDIKREEE